MTALVRVLHPVQLPGSYWDRPVSIVSCLHQAKTEVMVRLDVKLATVASEDNIVSAKQLIRLPLTNQENWGYKPQKDGLQNWYQAYSKATNFKLLLVC